MNKKSNSTHKRLSFAEKNANDKQWYKDWADLLDSNHNQLYYDGEVSEFKRMKVNYDLFNNNINPEDFSYVCQPFGANVGELPAKMVNRDIVSSKIKAILGMESRMPFGWSVLAVNPEATTRKEQQKAAMIRDFVVNMITQPIREQVEMQTQQELQGRELSPEEQQQVLQEMEERVKAMTPEEVKKYMEREYQDPAEVLANQLLHYTTQKLNMEDKFSTMFKHGLLSAIGVMYVSVLGGEPVAWNVNSLRFNFQNSPDSFFIEDAESATCEYRMLPSEVVKFFGDELTEKQIDHLYEYSGRGVQQQMEAWLESDSDEHTFSTHTGTVRVVHCVWKALRKIGFLHYIDEEGSEQEKLVDEGYKIDPNIGDLFIEWEWIPEVYQTWKIGDEYIKMKPIEGQFKDINSVYECKLPYYGVVYDNLNSSKTSLMDRIKAYQYFYNIVWYRLELLLASDKGKKIMMNINAIPDSQQFDMEKWRYFFESSPFMFFDNNEEGSTYQDVNTIAKPLDFSLASDIQKYIEVAEYLRVQCGRSVGITDQVEGQVAPSEAVGNARQNLLQTSYILEPYFQLHAMAKRNILQALLEANKVAYAGKKSAKLVFVLDDMSQQILNLDTNLLDSSTFGLFVSDSTKYREIKDMLQQMTHAALQNQKVELSDVMSILKTESLTEAEEILQVAEDRRRGFEEQMQSRQQESEKERQEMAQKYAEQAHQWRMEEILLKEEEGRKTELAKTALMGASFNADIDKNDNGINDFVEIANRQVELGLKEKDLNLKADALAHKKRVDNEKLKLEKEKQKQQKR